MTKQAGTAYRFIGAHLDNLHDGRPLEPFAIIHLTQPEVEDPGNSRLFDENLLQELAVPEPAAKPRGRKETLDGAVTTGPIVGGAITTPPLDDQSLTSPAAPPSDPLTEPTATDPDHTEEESK